MPLKCPYCETELDIGVKIEPVKIEDQFKDDALLAMESFIDIQASAAPIGGKMMKSMAKFSLKWVKRYFDEIGALPLLVQFCKNCEKVISSQILINPLSGSGQSS